MHHWLARSLVVRFLASKMSKSKRLLTQRFFFNFCNTNDPTLDTFMAETMAAGDENARNILGMVVSLAAVGAFHFSNCDMN